MVFLSRFWPISWPQLRQPFFWPQLRIVFVLIFPIDAETILNRLVSLSGVVAVYALLVQLFSWLQSPSKACVNRALALGLDTLP